MKPASPGARPTPRISSGVPGLDELLDGGFFSGSAFIVSGTPGSGKTILANQIAFSRAAAGKSVLYMTLLAESHGRMLQHMRQMSFYDPDAVPNRISYVGAFDILENEGLMGLMRLVHAEIEAHNANVVVLDGLFIVEDRAESTQAFRRFVHDLQGMAEVKDCLILMLTNGRAKGYAPEHTMVDGWIDLHFERRDLRAFREIEIHKFRGSDFLSGAHKFRIDEHGIHVFPRIEALLSCPSLPDRDIEDRVATGVGALDRMLGGGVGRGTATLVMGPTGSGKTTLGLNFIAQCTADSRGLFVGFYESPSRLVAKAQNLGQPLDTSDAVDILWCPATEYYADELCHEILRRVRNNRVARVVVDGLAALRRMLIHGERLPALLTAMANELRARDATCMFTLEVAENGIGAPLSSVVDFASSSENIVVLEVGERRGRLVRRLMVRKSRDSAFDPVPRELRIERGGFALGAARRTQKTPKRSAAGRTGSRRPRRRPRDG